MPNEFAVLAPDRPPLSFGALWNHIEEVARALTDRGIRRGDTVASVLPDDAETLCAFLGVTACAGFAPLNPALREAEFESCLTRLRPAVVFLPENDESAAGCTASALGIPILPVRSTPERGAGRFFIAGLDAATGRVTLPEPADSALLLHTSATTGQAKLVCLTHGNIAAMAWNSIGAMRLTRGDRFLSMMPLFHLQGLLSAFEQLMVGGSVVCASPFRAELFAAWMEEFQPTWYTAGPALHRAILKCRDKSGEIAWRSRLRFIRSMGAALPSGLLSELEGTFGVPVVEGYGLTETGAVTSTPLPPQRRKPGSAGISIGPEIAVTDKEGSFLPAGGTGEIVVRGPSVMLEYRGNREATRSAFRDGWFRTGDLGCFDGDGYLYVTGRIKEMINRGGEKVLPGEIDAALMDHPAVADAAAFGVPHRTLGEDVAAAVVLSPGAQVRDADLRRHAIERLAPFKVPRRIVYVDTIPKGATGKPQRHRLVELHGSEVGGREGRPFVEARTEVEQALAGIWSRVLSSPRIGVEDDFYALGGDSFALNLLFAEVENEFGEVGDPSGFFADPTIVTLARQVSSGSAPPRRDNAESSSVFVLQPNGGRTPFFCIPGASEDPYYLRHLARALGRDQPVYVLRDPRPASERGAYTIEQVAKRFAAAVRRVRPQGPYVLGGHCYGGIVAFELARQMSAAGDDIALLALFDTPTPGYPKVVRQWRQYGREALRLIRTRNVDVREAVSHVRFLARLAGKNAVRLERNPVQVTSASEIDTQAAGAAANEAAAKVYIPAPFSGKLVVFLAGDEEHSTRVLDDSRLGWRDFAMGGFDVRRAQGMHNSMFCEPHVGEIARQLEALMQPIQAAAGDACG